MLDNNVTSKINFEGSGNLSSFIKDLLDQAEKLLKATKDQGKELSKFNEIGEDTQEVSKNLLIGIRDFAKEGEKVKRDSKRTISFFGDLTEKAVDLNEALEGSTKGLAGIATSIAGTKPKLELFSSLLSGPVNSYLDISEAQGTVEKGMVILTKVQKPLSSSLKGIATASSNTSKYFKDLSSNTADLATNTSHLAGKVLGSFSSALENLQKNLKNTGFIGRAISQSLGGVNKSVQQAKDSINELADGFSPENFKGLDQVGKDVGKVLDNISGKAKKANLGLGLVVGFQKIKETGEAALTKIEDLKDSYFDLNKRIEDNREIIDKGVTFIKSKITVVGLLVSGFKTLGDITKNQALVGVSKLILQYTSLASTLLIVKNLVNSLSDAYIKANGLNDTFDVMQRMGIDTTAAQMAMQFGLVGEKLLFSADAAKEFGKSAITAFTSLEDSAAFVTTLGAGAKFQMDGYAEGVDSISAAMSELVNGPLNNAVTSLDATNALYNSLSAGVGVARDGTVKLGEANDFLTASLKLSSGTGADAAQTLELLAKTSNIYKISTAEAASTAAKLYQVVEQGITTFPQLTSGMGRTLATAKGVGVAMDEALGSITALTQVMTSDDAMTGFSSLLSSIAGQSEGASAELKELGIRFDVNTIRSKGLLASLKELYAATGGNSTQIKKIIPDLLAYQTAMTLMTTAGDRAAKAFESISNTGEEALDTVFSNRQQSTVQQFSLIMNGFNEVLIDFGRRAIPMIQPGVDMLSNLLTLVQNLPEPVKALIGTIVLVQSSFSNIGGAIFDVVLMLGKMAFATITARLAMKGFKNLAKEWEVLKDINKDGLDVVSTFLRLIGMNENFDLSVVRVNRTIKQQQELLKEFDKVGIDFSGQISDAADLKLGLHQVNILLEEHVQKAKQLEPLRTVSFTHQIKKLENELNKLRNVATTDAKEKVKEIKEELAKLKNMQAQKDLKLIDLNATEVEIEKLKKLKKKIEKFQEGSKKVRFNLLEDLHTNMKNILTKSEITLDQKTEVIKAKVSNYFATFGEVGKQYNAEVTEVFTNVLLDANLSTNQKVEAINLKFLELGKGVAPEVRDNLEKIRGDLVLSVRKIEGTFLPEIAAMGNGVKFEFQKLSNSISGILENPETTIAFKIEQINRLFETIGSKSPPLIKERIKELQNSIVNSLEGARPVISAAIKKTASNFEEFNSEVAIVLQDPEVSIEQKVFQVNEAFARIGKNAAPKVKTSLAKLRELMLSQLTKLKEEAETKREQIGGSLAKLVNEDLAIEIRENLENVSSTFSSTLEEIKTEAEQTVQSTAIVLAQTGKLKSTQPIEQNLNEVEEAVAREMRSINQVISEGVEKSKTSITELGQKINQKAQNAGQGLSSLANLMSNFNPIFGQAVSIGQDLGDVYQDVIVKSGALGKAQKALTGAIVIQTAAAKKSTVFEKMSSAGKLVATKTTNLYNASLFQLGVTTQITAKAQLELASSTNTNAVAQLKAAKITAFISKGKALLASSTSILTKGLAALKVAFVKLAAFLAPFLAKALLVVGALALLHKAVQILIPAYGQATDANMKLQAQMEKNRETIRQTTEEIQGLTESLDELSERNPNDLGRFANIGSQDRDTQREAVDLTYLSDEELVGMTGNTLEEVREFREQVTRAMVPDEKTVLTGWLGILVNILEETQRFIFGFAAFFPKMWANILNGFAGFAQSLLKNIPIIGGVFDKVKEKTEDILNSVRRSNGESEQAMRKFFNNVRDAAQEFYNKGIREASYEARAETERLIYATNVLRTAYIRGGVAFQESQDLLADAARDQRALTAEEMQNIVQNEQELYERTREEITATIALKQEELDAAKDPVVRRNIEAEISMLENRNIELERGKALQDQWIQNTNAMLVLRDTNDGTKGTEKTLERLNAIYQEMPAAAQRAYLEATGYAVNAENEIVEVTDNMANAVQRRTLIATAGAISTFEDTVARLNDPESMINPDKFSTDLINVLQAVDAQVAEGTITQEAGEAIKEQYRKMQVEIVDSQGNVQRGLAEDFLRGDQLQELNEGVLNSIRTTSERAVAIQEEELKDVENLRALNGISAVEHAQRIAEINESISVSRLETEQRILAEMARQNGEGTQAYIEQQRKIAQMERDLGVQRLTDRKRIIDEEIAAVESRAANEIKAMENVTQVTKNEMEIRSKVLNLQKEMAQSQADLNSAVLNLENTELQNKLKFTGDIVEKAKIELELTQNREDALLAQQEIERLNLEIQEQLTMMGLEREKIELRIADAKLRVQILTAKMKLENADELNLREGERRALELEIDALEEQQNLNRDLSGQLENQIQAQEVMNQRRRETMALQQEAARQTSAADVELAQLAVVNAQYEKQKELLKLAAEEQEMSGRERLQNLSDQEDILNNQVNLMQKQLDIVKSTQEVSQKLYDMAKENARTAFRQRQIEREAIVERLRNMESIQSIERANLAVQQQQRQLALERKQIELEVAEAKAQADLATAQAELARLNADPRTTDEQRRAGELAVRAQQVAIQGTGLQRRGLERERELNAFTNQQEIINQNRDFQSQRLEARQALANTTRGGADNRQLGDEALALARGAARELRNLLTQNPAIGGATQQRGATPTSFSSPVQNILAPQSSGGRVSQLSNTVTPSATGQAALFNAANNPSRGNSSLELNGRVNVILQVEGSAANSLDRTQLQQSASDGLYQGLSQLLDYAIQRGGA